MFTVDAIIDAVQTSNKTIVNTFVTNEATKEAMIKFIDTQTDYTKKAAKVSTDTVAKVTNEAVKQVQEAAKFDWVQATQDMFAVFAPKTAKAK